MSEFTGTADQGWQFGGVYDEVIIDHEAEFAVGTHAARGSRIDYSSTTTTDIEPASR
ncbi:hypothetical protein [Nocardia cyriacigeorgica]|uniref:hypothetical protein n=1 Tax=Nocardia cyriacigeorgica TaxID=135487 RepID=UPI00189349E5|nr:hypothetical protein [Nocardia cyriacigeorgica]MBF6434932.1 hypothetical protein [Nocardia cyriacigeorgica]MBF6480436.1 hypothetical protein [Nocardia cyriacigeorgica]